MSEQNYRIRTNIIDDKVVRTKIQQDIDFLEILSLKIKQEDTYKLCVSNYGVIVGRVLGNDAFGIPNAKVSVFLKLSDEDAQRSDITSLYPYTSVQTKDKNNIRYNLLPDSSNDTCYRIVGTFPNKRLILDNDTEIEIYEKYWKYTTVTNNAGDYMIFGVPTGNQQIHVDIDLSDIGLLSQKPRDFIYKGYNITQFDNSSQFKESTNLDNLTQILSQDSNVYVYPFWGDDDAEEIAISRCDIQLQYKFEPTCVFIGSILTDGFSNSIGHKCQPNRNSGINKNLVGLEGNIEMIRKTPDNLVEQIAIQGNKLIDGDGVWCYQIPMNLDYVGTDEFGNIVPVENPNKGIPTKTTVRFRFTLQETDNDGIGRHRARYLVPNNPKIVTDNATYITNPQIANGKKFNQCFDFGSATQDEYYRDLYWNKVYSVKNYIPRFQLNKRVNTFNYSALRNANFSEDKNPIPFNNIRIRLTFVYVVLCVLTTILVNAIGLVNRVISLLDDFCIVIKAFDITLIDWCPFSIGCIPFNLIIDEEEVNDKRIEYFPKCEGRAKEKHTRCEEPGCYIESMTSTLIDKVQTSLASEYEIVNLDFYNDWINGSLYFPLWYWRKIPKKTFFFGLIKLKAKNDYCSCEKEYRKMRLAEACALNKNNDYSLNESQEEEYEQKIKTTQFIDLKFGIIKEVENRDGLRLYYYMPGIPTNKDYQSIDDKVSYKRLYSTDIILLGSINNCDMDNLPNLVSNLPSTTANIPFIDAVKDEVEDEKTQTTKEVILNSGMDWTHDGLNDKPQFAEGLFFDLNCLNAWTKIKTCVNVKRLSELGVGLDGYYEIPYARNGKINYNLIYADGLINRFELIDNDSRAMFASMNHIGLSTKAFNTNTKYDTYLMKYIYPVDFDGHLNGIAEQYSRNNVVITHDDRNEDYIKFKFGENNNHDITYIYNENNSFPIFNNSFYFYFGLKEGSTAIDKFNKLFYSPCYQNTKLPFYFNYQVIPGKWCYIMNSEHAKTDFGIIEVNLDDIKTPYSYMLMDEFNKVIMYETDMDINTLYFGVSIIDGGNGYQYTEDGYLVKDARLRKYKTGEAISGKSADGYYYLTNDTYKLLISDANENKITETIKLEPDLITVSYEELKLGDKYDDKISKISDFCNEFDNYGEIRIKTFVIDKITYYIDAVGIKPDGIGASFNGIYDLRLKSVLNDNYEYVQMVIQPQLDDNFVNCTCRGLNGIPEWNLVIDDDNKENTYLTFSIWRPYSYECTITQYCSVDDSENKVLSSNSNQYIINIQNGEKFEGYLNTIPLKFILGDNKNVDAYNVYFNNSDATSPSDLIGWFHLDDVKYYNFPTSEYANYDIWKELINVNYEVSLDGKTFVFDKQSKFNILKYKFDALMKMCQSSYIVDTNNNNFVELTSTGGKPLILNRCLKPYFEDFNDKDNNDINFLFNSESVAYCNNIIPTIVGNNYYNNKNYKRFYDKNTNLPFFNKKISNGNEHMGIYFSIFTNNGGFKFNNLTNCETDAEIGYESIPYKCNVIDEFCPGTFNEINDVPELIYKYNDLLQTYPYFRSQFIDKRLDYELYISLPYRPNIFMAYNLYIQELNTNNINDDKSIQYYYMWDVCVLRGLIYNGNLLSYDENYNIISSIDNLEYTYTDDDIIKNNNINALLNKQLYSMNLFLDRDYYIDLRKHFWKITDYNEDNTLVSSFNMLADNDKIIYAPLNSNLSIYDYDMNNGKYSLYELYNKVKDKEYYVLKVKKNNNFLINDILQNHESLTFDERHYPIVQYFETEINKTISESLTFTYQSCSYDTTSKIFLNDLNANNNIYLNSNIKGSIEESFSIDTFQQYRFYISDNFINQLLIGDFDISYKRNTYDWRYSKDSSIIVLKCLYPNDRIVSYYINYNKEDSLFDKLCYFDESGQTGVEVDFTNEDPRKSETEDAILNLSIQILNDKINSTHNIVHLQPELVKNPAFISNYKLNYNNQTKENINTFNRNYENITNVYEKEYDFSNNNNMSNYICHNNNKLLYFKDTNKIVYESDNILDKVNFTLNTNVKQDIYGIYLNKFYFNKLNDNLLKNIYLSQLVDVIDTNAIDVRLGYEYIKETEDEFDGVTLFLTPQTNKGQLFNYLNNPNTEEAISKIDAYLRMYQISGSESQRYNSLILSSKASNIRYRKSNNENYLNRFEFRFEFLKNQNRKSGVVLDSDTKYDYDITILIPNYPAIMFSIQQDVFTIS